MDPSPEEISTTIDRSSRIHAISYRNIYMATFAAELFIMAMGLVSSYSSPALVDILKPGSRFSHLTTDQITWIASLPNLFGVFGNVLSGYVSHRFGRKCVLMYISVSFTLSWLLIAYAPTVGFIYAGRILSGASAGFCSVVVPAYVVEVSTDEIRGFLTAGFQVTFTLGVFVTTASGIFLRWSWLAVLGAAVVVTAAFLLYFMPESPPWLVRKSRNEEALKGLKFLRGHKYDAVEEFNEILKDLEQEPQSGFTIRELSNPGLYKPLMITFGLMFNQTFCGSPAIMSYAVKMFKEQSDMINPNVAATIVFSVQVLTTAISSLLMDRAGRKVLYVISGICMTVSLTVLGLFAYFSRNCDGIALSYWSWVPLVCFIIYISAYSLGLGPMPFVVIPELIPTHTRSFVMAVGCTSASLLSFAVIKSFELLRTAIGFYGLYWLYGIFTFCGFLWYWIFVPETKGRSIHEINESFTNYRRI